MNYFNTEKKQDLPQRPLRLCGENSGFSLLEVLVAMTVLVVIVLMVTNMFRDTSTAWDSGTQSAEMNTAARAAIEYISRELSCAVAGTIQDSTGGVAIVKRFKLTDTPDLIFVAMSGDDRNMRGVKFVFADHSIMTTNKTDSQYIYSSGYDWDVEGWYEALLITNVWNLTITVCSNENQMTNGVVGCAYDSSDAKNSNMLPACVDISLEMLSEQNMARALSLDGDDQTGFVMTNSRVYTTRVCFPNRGAK